MLESEEEFTGVWAENDLLAIGAMREMERLGIRIPEDISIVGMDDIKTTEMVLPALDHRQATVPVICEKAVDLLMNGWRVRTTRRAGSYCRLIWCQGFSTATARSNSGLRCLPQEIERHCRR